LRERGGREGERQRVCGAVGQRGGLTEEQQLDVECPALDVLVGEHTNRRAAACTITPKSATVNDSIATGATSGGEATENTR
jgi:hypothetical protein